MSSEEKPLFVRWTEALGNFPKRIGRPFIHYDAVMIEQWLDDARILVAELKKQLSETLQELEDKTENAETLGISDLEIVSMYHQKFKEFLEGRNKP